MQSVKVKFCNGDCIVTSINGTPEQIKAYYTRGRTFNLGGAEGADRLTKVTTLEFLTPKEGN